MKLAAIAVVVFLMAGCRLPPPSLTVTVFADCQKGAVCERLQNNSPDSMRVVVQGVEITIPAGQSSDVTIPLGA